MIIASLLIPGRGLLHMHPVFYVLRRMAIPGFYIRRGNPYPAVFVQQGVAHVHVVQDFHRFYPVPCISDNIMYLKRIFQRGYPDFPLQPQFPPKNHFIFYQHMQHQQAVLFPPADLLTGLVCNGAMKRKLFPLIGAGGTHRLQAAGREKPCRKRFQPVRSSAVVICGSNVTAGGQIAHVDSPETQPCNIPGPVRRNDKLHPLTVGHLQNPHAVSLSAHKTVFFHPIKLRIMSDVWIHPMPPCII